MRSDLTHHETIKPVHETIELVIDTAADPDAHAWWIRLPPETTVVDLAALMHGLGCKVRADHQGDGVYHIWPLDRSTPPPTEEHICDILTRGFDEPLPSLMARMET